MAEEIQETIGEFERGRMQLMSINAQKQQLQLQSSAMKATLEELAKTKEKKVYKAVGNILFLSDTDKVKKELAEQKEFVELKLKTVQKQEDALIEKMNRLKAKIEAAQSPAAKTKPEKEGKK